MDLAPNIEGNTCAWAARLARDTGRTKLSSPVIKLAASAASAKTEKSLRIAENHCVDIGYRAGGDRSKEEQRQKLVQRVH